MAREFQVSCSAICTWESGSRGIPGPVLKLIDLYETYLEQETDSGANEHYLRTLSCGWADRLTTTLRSASGFSAKDIRRSFENAFFAFLEGNLSRDILKRKIQVALLKRSIESVGRMKGLPLKAAQILTYIRPSLAPELRGLLLEMQFVGRPMAPTVAAKVIYDEFGRRPDELFSEWSAKPFAVASIGQVHRARLRTGEVVAVKIQYPDVRKSMERDFRDLAFLQPIASLLKPIDREVLEHIREVVIDECDYKKELENLQKFRALFQDRPGILIPRPYSGYSRNRVLTMDLIEGQTLPEFVASSTQDQRDQAGEIIWRFTMESQLKHGLMNCDAHAGNFLFLKDRVAFLDFGRVHRVNPEQLRAYREFCVCFALGDRDKARAVFRELPFIVNPESTDFNEFWNVMLVQQRHAIAGQPFRFSHPYIAEGMRASRRLQTDDMKLTDEILWVNCASYGLWSVFAELGASARWGDLAVEVLGRPGVA